ncbi:MAG TPA: cytochrome P450 [Longimicrobium sp.]|nr:cytochrome P450 [Longimicrobium sp.]
MMDFLSDDIRRDPYPLYARLREASPLLHDPRMDAWMVFDYDGVKRTLQDHESFSGSPATAGRPAPDWFIFADPPRHTRMRGLLARAFTPRSVAALEPRIRWLSRALLDRSIERGEMDLAADFSVPLPLLVIAEMVGIPVADRPRFNRWGDVILDLSHTLPGGDGAERASQAYRAVAAEMHDYVARLVDDRRVDPADDLLTRLVHAEVEGERLTTLEILGFVQLLLIAGQETTTNLLNNAILCFIQHPDQLARLRAMPHLLPSAIEEVLRYRSPVQWMFRFTRTEVQMHGTTIPAGTMVLPMIGSANHDAAHFADPERFDVARDPNPHLAFGHGIHHCIGAALGRLEARIALADLLERLHDVELASAEPWEPRRALHVHGPARLPIRFKRGERAAGV